MTAGLIAQTTAQSNVLAATVCGIAAVVFAGLVAVPQVMRVLRTRDTQGISASTAALTVVACFSWVVYGVIQNIPWTIVSCVAAALTWVPLLAMLVRAGRWTRRSQVAIVGVCAGLAAILLTAGVAVYGLSLVGLGIFQYAPQVRIAMTSTSLTGVSVMSQILYFLCAVANLGIGLLASDVPLVAWAVTFMAASSIVAFRRITTDEAMVASFRRPLVALRISRPA